MAGATVSRWTEPEHVLIVGGAVLNGTWEALATPLYADGSREWSYLLWTRAHCTAGDVLLLLFAHAVTALAFRDRKWIWRSRAVPFASFVTIGIAYTTWSEWFNTRIAGSWEYADAMPTILGLGLVPLAQWLVVPPALIEISRRLIPRASD